jgi:hypothetical protein
MYPGYIQIKQQYHKIEPPVIISFIKTTERDTGMHAYILLDMKNMKANSNYSAMKQDMGWGDPKTRPLRVTDEMQPKTYKSWPCTIEKLSSMYYYGHGSPEEKPRL